MTVNYIMDFKEKETKYKVTDSNFHSILDNRNIQLEKKVLSIEGSSLYDDLLIIDKNYTNLDIKSCDILILTEPKGEKLTEKELKSFFTHYEALLVNALRSNLPIVHLVTNPKWFGAFRELLNKYNIQIFGNLNNQENLRIENEININTRNYIPLSKFINYSNSLKSSIILDLTQAHDKKHHYNLNFKALLDEAKEFSEIDIIINDNSFIPTIDNQKINIFKESEYSLDRFKKITYVYFHSNDPYSTRNVDKLLFYAANSKVLFTDYNYYINNLLPSVIMNMSKDGYNIGVLPEKEAFDILNENRNTVLFNNTILNVINELVNIYFGAPYIKHYSLSETLFDFVDHQYYKSDEKGIKIDLHLKDFKYDLEKTLLLPILFMGKGTTFYGSSKAQYFRGIEELLIPVYTEKTPIDLQCTKDLSMIIPIHNNGRYLKFKCLNSILSLSCLNNLEILFIDDGSTDSETVRIVEDIMQEYPSIVYKKFNEGSGSASRPRNVGMRIASGKYITFLDPDNEAIEDGYSKLFSELKKHNEVDMIVGDIVREDNLKRNDISYYKKVKRVQDSVVISNTKDVLMKTNLAVQSIQALIVKKEIVERNDLKMIEGAAGQDTLFFQEIILKCNKIRVINQNVHSYYAYVEGSITNTVSPKFFDKFYKVEVERIQFLEKENLINFYMEIRFNSYLRNWYLSKFQQVVGEDDRREALEIIHKIIDLYKEYNCYFDKNLLHSINYINKEDKA